MRPLFDHLSARQANAYQLVLAAAYIPHHLRPNGEYWAIDVPTARRSAAVRSIALYLAENRPAPAEMHVDGPGQRTFSAAYVTATLIALHWAIRPGMEQKAFFGVYGADADKITSGEIYRCITALLLHADAAHLFSNCLGLALFGTAVASVCGWGIGWFIILLGGIGGNYWAAAWYESDHLAVGSSTALFAAVGICAVLTFRRQFQPGMARSWRVWSPLAGGLALLGLMGTAPGTDLLSHLFGFVVGSSLGAIYALLCTRPPSLMIQLTAAIAGVLLLIGGWSWGLYTSG
jgi:membrane associated rhomboid family serine protease